MIDMDISKFGFTEEPLKMVTVDRTLQLDPEDEGPIQEELILELGSIWDLAHMSVAEIRAKTGLSQAKFAERFCIPRRTVENWESRGGCPDYVRLLLLRSCSLL